MNPNLVRLTPVKKGRARFDSGVYEYRPETVKINRTNKHSSSFNETQTTDFIRGDEQKFQSSTTVPSTTDGDQQTTLCVTEVQKRKNPTISKRRLIFKNKKMKQVRQEFSELLTQDHELNELLQAKINYFFKPYSGDSEFAREPPMNFREEQGQSPETSDNVKDQDAQINWNRL